MGRLVVISNRVADPRKPAAGGLAVALGESLQQTGGLWFGWSGHIVEGGTAGEGEVHKQQAGPVTLAMIDLSREDHDSYYLGYSNDVLWPVFHYRLDLAHFDAGFIGGYRRVNQLFARKVMPMLKPDDIIWIHDYHLIPLAAELRAMGCKQRMGFFLHIPLPPQEIMAAIPQHEWLVRSLFAFDLIGLQTHQDVQHFERYVIGEAHGDLAGHGAHVGVARLRDETFHSLVARERSAARARIAHRRRQERHEHLVEVLPPLVDRTEGRDTESAVGSQQRQP